MNELRKTLSEKMRLRGEKLALSQAKSLQKRKSTHNVIAVHVPKEQHAKWTEYAKEIDIGLPSLARILLKNFYEGKIKITL